ncbi:MAG: rhodanese-like domain-containing protein [Candidatus Krumholzibacteria bacterium]|nr:rhodanese-like domain-containing protein [Candidatus Krumholzibacteria bacterium]MDH4338525.1 rhodanese-like domain-containing protein [Candidatus Krumholzibacteria bacterium]MDH5269895.1 rhodanese-like domain-containing protein [Candidatus Krumholzibacteria bacterium]MDH5627878.1 rhodanese-like domain-containing protein [Candidatus Krumholzibacteria bacterium]
MYFRQIFDQKLAQYAYLIGCQASGEAIIIDPMRDVDRYFDIAAQDGLRIVAAADTHIHADYLSGLREMAERPGVTVYASGEGGSDWQFEWLRGSHYAHRILMHGDQLMVGNIRFDVIFTPGHTPEHLCYLVTDTASGSPVAMGLLSGDFVFVGDLGRPDLLETAAGHSGTMETSARTLYRSLEKFRALSPSVQVWPGHGAGSACGKALGAVPMSTVGYELVVNPALLAATSEDAFVAYILDGQPEPPLYFARMKRDNRGGPRVLGRLPVPKKVSPNKLSDLSGATGVAVLDTRDWASYAKAHLPGSLFTPLNRAFNTIAGSYVPEKMVMYLIVEEARLREAVVDLVHVGLDDIAGYATPEMFQEYARRGKVASVAEIEAPAVEQAVAGGAFLLDVRRAAELAEEGRIPGAHNIAHTRLLERIQEVPRGRPVIVYCSTGSRSAYAAGLLDRMGYRATNVAGGIESWTARGGAVATA